MLEDVVHDGTTDSSPTDVQTADPSAGTQNTAPNGQPSVQPAKEPPFHLHPRFQQVIGENRSLKSELAKLTQTVQELQRTASQPARTADEKQQRGEALKALRELIGEDPELANLLNIAKEYPQLRQGQQAIEGMAKSQQEAELRPVRAHIATLAKEAGLPTAPRFTKHLVQLVAEHAQEIPNGSERFDRGDLTVLDEAFEAVKKEYFGQLQRNAATTVLDTKNQTRRLPPALRNGSGTGARDGLPKLDPANPSAFREAVSKGAMARLAELQGA